MNHEEKKRIKQKRRINKLRQKEYIREERKSIKKQKQEAREVRRTKRGKPGLLTRIRHIFGFARKDISNKYEKDIHTDKRRYEKSKKSEFEKQQKSLRKQKKELRRKTRPMRQKIHKARLEGIKRRLKSFLKNPIKVKKTKGAEKLLKRQIRKDVIEITLRNIYQSPIVLAQRIGKFWKNRRMRWKFFLESVRNAFGTAQLMFQYKDLRRGFFITFVNSTIFFLLGFLFVFYIHQFVTILTASLFDIPTSLYSYRIYWPLYTYSSLYTRLALIVIFGIGPVVSLILGFVFFRLYLITRFRTIFLKTFFLWSSIHAYNLFFGSYITGVITRTGFIYSSEWLFLSGVFDIKEIIFLILSVIMLIVIGSYFTKHFLYTSNSNNLIEPKLRGMFIIGKVMIPWIVGNLILFGMNIPHNPIELIFIYITTIVVVFMTLTNYNSPSLRLIKLPRQPVRFRISWMYLIIVLLVIVGLRISLENGLSFG